MDLCFQNALRNMYTHAQSGGGLTSLNSLHDMRFVYLHNGSGVIRTARSRSRCPADVLPHTQHLQEVSVRELPGTLLQTRLLLEAVLQVLGNLQSLGSENCLFLLQSLDGIQQAGPAGTAVR